MSTADANGAAREAAVDAPARPMRRTASSQLLQGYLEKNKAWAASQRAVDPKYFENLVDLHPNWYWIGCAESRLPANELLGLQPGEVFVQRNVGNLCNHKDINNMSCLEYAVSGLQVQHIVVCGHYGCGAVRAALTMPCKNAGLVNLWIQDIRSIRDKHADTLRSLHGKEQVDKLVEYNVVRQVYNICTSPIVQNAWAEGQQLAVHCLVYSVSDGILKELSDPVTSLEDLDRFSLENMDELRHLSLSVLKQGSFEKEALVWENQKHEAMRYRPPAPKPPSTSSPK